MKSPFATAFVASTASRYHVRFGGHGSRGEMTQLYNSHSSEGDEVNSRDGNISRRSLLHSAGMSFAGTVSSGPLSALLRSMGVDPNHAAHAMGLVQFPCKPGDLTNMYHMMRAGESMLEAEGILSTNPLFLTNRDDALTDLGMQQVEEACNAMMSNGINPSVVKYSLASKCMDTANIVATKMMVGRNRIVPEFTFMDPRGAGLWNGKPLASTEAAIWAMDAAEAGDEGRNGKPPPNDDGTANETLFEQVTRLRQLISIMETQYSGDDILLIFPDGTSPALLSCLIAGIPLKNVHALNFSPGELRQGVNMQNSRQLLKDKLTSTEYTDVLAMGKDELKHLRKEHEEQQLLAKEEANKSLIRVSRQSEPALLNEQDASLLNDQRSSYKDDLFSAGAVGTMGALVSWRGGKDDPDTEIETSSESIPASPVLAYANSTGTTVFEPQQVTAVPVATPDITPQIPVDTTQTTAANLVDASALELNPNVFQDVPVLSKNDRIEAAEQAMEEYLNQDDGGDAWLTSMKDIMGEE